MDTNNKKKVSFLLDNEQKEFNKPDRFINRKIKISANDTVEKQVDTFLSQEYGRFRSDENRENSFKSAWIECQSDDGVSWVAEKLRLTFERNHKPNSIYILKGKEYQIDGLPLITKLIGTKSFINSALDSKLISTKYNLFNLISILLLVSSCILVLVPAFSMALQNSNWKTIMLEKWWMLLPLIVASTIKWLVDFYYKNDKSDFLATVLNKIKINEEKTERECEEYKKFINNLSRKIRSLDSPRIIIIDEFSQLDTVSLDVLINFFNSEKGFGTKEYWIILDTNSIKKIAIHNDIKEQYFNFYELSLLTNTEKEEIIQKFNLSEEKIIVDTIKDLFASSANDKLQQSVVDKLKQYKTNSEKYSTLDFLYFLSINSAHNLLPMNKDYLIERIISSHNPPAIRVAREIYIKYILENVTLSKNEIKREFEKIETNFGDFLVKGKGFVVTQGIAKYLENNYEQFDFALPEYCQGYWGLFWYHYLQSFRLEIPWIQKLAYHLARSRVMPKNNNSLIYLFDSHIFALEKSILLFLRKETLELITSAYDLEIQKVDVSQIKDKNIRIDNLYEELQKLTLIALSNFHFKKEEIDLKQVDKKLYDVFNNNEINSELGKKLFDEVVFVTLNKYWINVLLLYLADNYILKNIKDDLDKLQHDIDKIPNSVLILKDYEIEQKIRNLTLYIWIQALKVCVSMRSINIHDIEDSKQHINEIIAIIEKINKSINVFTEFYNENDSRIQADKNIEYSLLSTTIQESALIIYSVSILIKTKTVFFDLDNKHIQTIQKICGIKTDIKNPNNDTTLDNILNLMSAQSLVWHKSGFFHREYLCNIFKTQIHFLLQNGYNNTNGFEIDLKNIVFGKEDISVIANLSLCAFFKNYSIEKAAYYFQNACRFINNEQITQSQLDILFLFLIKYNRNDLILKLGLNKFFELCDNLDCYLNDIDSFYLQTTNCLRTVKSSNEKDILKRLEQQLEKMDNSEEKIVAESYLKNYQFEILPDELKQKKESKEEFIKFWSDKKSIHTYSDALKFLLRLENSNLTQEIENEIFGLLDIEYSNYSGFLTLAEQYCRLHKKEDIEKIKIPLRFLRENTQHWENNINVSTIQQCYDTLCKFDNSYAENLARINFKVTEVEDYKTFQAFLHYDFFSVFEQTFDIWERFIDTNGIDWNEYYKILSLDTPKKIQYVLNNYTQILVPISNNLVNLQFILFGKILSKLKENEKNGQIIDIYNVINNLSQKYFDNLVNIIVNLPAVEKIAKHIRNYYTMRFDCHLPDTD